MRSIGLSCMTILAVALVTGFGAARGQVPQKHREAYARILATHVDKGRVDYKGLAATDLGTLEAYVAALGEASVPSDRNARLGFYIDAYNALVLKAVLDTGRPRSVLDVDGFFNARKHRVAGTSVTLDHLEKKVLNPYAKDPRTHFVLVCAAVGCPILESKPFYGTPVDRRMERATRRYLASPQGARWEGGKLLISKLFDWYAQDFGGPAGAKTFVLEHLPSETRKAAGEDPDVGHIEYNWTLNQQ